MDYLATYRGRLDLLKLLPTAVVLVVLMTACSAVDVLDRELPDDGPPPATSPAAARRFAEKALLAAESASHSGRFSVTLTEEEVVGSSRVDLQACKLEYSIVSPK